VKSAEESVIVVLIDETVTKDDEALWPRQKQLSSVFLIPGLKVSMLTEHPTAGVMHA
jgi:hypothetical protein